MAAAISATITEYVAITLITPSQPQDLQQKGITSMEEADKPVRFLDQPEKGRRICPLPQVASLLRHREREEQNHGCARHLLESTSDTGYLAGPTRIPRLRRDCDVLQHRRRADASPSARRNSCFRERRHGAGDVIADRLSGRSVSNVELQGTPHRRHHPGGA